MKRCILFAVFCAISLQADAALYQQHLTFATTTPQVNVAPGEAIHYSGSFDVGDSWSSTSPPQGVMTERPAVNPDYQQWLVCQLNPFGDCGPEPPRTITIRNGWTYTVTSVGEMGFTASGSIEAGSVQPRLDYGVAAEIPEPGSVAIGEAFSLKAQSAATDGAMDLRSASFGLTVGTYLSVTDTFRGEVCVSGACTTWVETLDHVEDDGELFRLTPNDMTFFDGFMPDLAGLTIPVGNVEAEFRLRALPPYRQVSFSHGLPPIPPGAPSVAVDAAGEEVHIPQFRRAGTLGSDGVLRATGEDDLFDTFADIDLLFGFPGGVIVEAGPFEVTVDLHDIEAGSTYDHFVEVDLASELGVRFDFSQPVTVEGTGPVSEWEGLWNEMPDFAVSGPTLFTPTFFLDAQMTSRAGIQRGWFGRREIVKGSVQLGPATAEFGPVVDDLWELEPELLRFALIDTGPFAFGGFGTLAGEPFWVEPAEVLRPIPLPASAPALLAALAAAALLRRRGRPGCRGGGT